MAICVHFKNHTSKTILRGGNLVISKTVCKSKCTISKTILWAQSWIRVEFLDLELHIFKNISKIVDLDLHIFEIISEIIDLHVQITDLELQIKDLDVQIYYLCNILKNLEVQIG